MRPESRVTLRSYPKPTSTVPLELIQPRPLPPLERLSLPDQLPLPPSSVGPVDPVLSRYFSVSTHLVPAAHPRLTPPVPPPSPPKFSTDKAEFKSAVENTLDEILGWRVKQWKGELDTLEPNRTVLWNCVKRFVKKDPSKISSRPLTLFFAHANGFPKEIWEPTLAYLLEENMASSNPVDITEVWLWEAVNHGDSALVNANDLGGLYDWTDNSRDILNFLLNYLPVHPATKSLPMHLVCLPDSLATSRRAFGFQSRTFVVIGHSFGGCTSYRAALECPTLFASLILVDPIISPWKKGTELILERQQSMARSAIRRRSHWSSKQEALTLFKQSPFFSAWDVKVLESYIEHGTYDDPKGGVSLKMSGLLEAMVFSEALTNYETWQLAESLDPRIELRWIMPGRPTLNEIPKDEMVWRRPENSSNVIIPHATHLISHDAPKDLACELQAFLSKNYGAIHSPAKL